MWSSRPAGRDVTASLIYLYIYFTTFESQFFTFHASPHEPTCVRPQLLQYVVYKVCVLIIGKFHTGSPIGCKVTPNIGVAIYTSSDWATGWVFTLRSFTFGYIRTRAVFLAGMQSMCRNLERGQRSFENFKCPHLGQFLR